MGYLDGSFDDVFSATISHSVLIFMYARQRTGLVNRNIIERNLCVDKKKFAFYKCCKTFALSDYKLFKA